MITWWRQIRRETDQRDRPMRQTHNPSKLIEASQPVETVQNVRQTQNPSKTRQSESSAPPASRSAGELRGAGDETVQLRQTHNPSKLMAEASQPVETDQM